MVKEFKPDFKGRKPQKGPAPDSEAEVIDIRKKIREKTKSKQETSDALWADAVVDPEAVERFTALAEEMDKMVESMDLRERVRLMKHYDNRVQGFTRGRVIDFILNYPVKEWRKNPILYQMVLKRAIKEKIIKY